MPTSITALPIIQQNFAELLQTNDVEQIKIAANEIAQSLSFVDEITVDSTITNALMVAAAAGDMDLVKQLRQKGIALQNTDAQDRTALIYAVRANQLMMVEQLIQEEEKGALQTKSGMTLLHFASSWGHTDLLRFLINYLAPVAVASEHISSDIASLPFEQKEIIQIDCKDSYGFTPLMRAAEHGHVAVLELLVSYGANLSECNPIGTPLMIASANNQLEAARFLLTKLNTAQINQKNNEGWTAGMLAAELGHVAVLELLVSYEASITECNNAGSTPLMIASANNQLEAARFLLTKLDADQIDRKNNNGWSSVMLAAEKGHVAVLNLLVSHKASITECTNKGWTPLMIASSNNQLEAVQFLLAKLDVAQIDRKNNNSWSSVMHAAEEGHVAVLNLLVSHKASITECTNKGWTPLMIASSNNQLEAVQFLLARLDLDQINLKNNSGWSSVMLAAEKGHVAVLNLLVSHKASITECTNKGWTPLMIASANNQLDAVEFLLSQLDPDQIERKNNDGWSSVMLTAEKGHIEVLKLLMSYGASIAECDNKDSTPLMIADVAGQEEVFQFLLAQSTPAQKNQLYARLDKMTSLEDTCKFDFLTVCSASTLSDVQKKYEMLTPSHQKSVQLLSAFLIGNMTLGQGVFIHCYFEEGRESYPPINDDQLDVIEWLYSIHISMDKLEAIELGNSTDVINEKMMFDMFDMSKLAPWIVRLANGKDVTTLKAVVSRLNLDGKKQVLESQASLTNPYQILSASNQHRMFATSRATSSEKLENEDSLKQTK